MLIEKVDFKFKASNIEPCSSQQYYTSKIGKGDEEGEDDIS